MYNFSLFQVKGYMDHLEKARRMMQFMDNQNNFDAHDEIRDLFPGEPRLDSRMKKTVMGLESGDDLSKVDKGHLKKAKSLKNIVVKKSKEIAALALQGRKVARYLANKNNLENLANTDEVKDLFPGEQAEVDERMKQTILAIEAGKDMEEGLEKEDRKEEGAEGGEIGLVEGIESNVGENGEDRLGEGAVKEGELEDGETKKGDDGADLLKLAEDKIKYWELAKSLHAIVVEKANAMDDDDDLEDPEIFTDPSINFGYPVDDEMKLVLIKLYSGEAEDTDDVDHDLLEEAKKIRVIIKSPGPGGSLSGISLLGGRPNQDQLGKLPTPPPPPPPQFGLDVAWTPGSVQKVVSDLDKASRDAKRGVSPSRPVTTAQPTDDAGLGDLLMVKPEITLDDASDLEDDPPLESPFPDSLGPYRIVQDAPKIRVTSAKVTVAMFGSAEAPDPVSMMDGRYVINPSVTFPDGPHQDKLHYDNIKLDDRYALGKNCTLFSSNSSAISNHTLNLCKIMPCNFSDNPSQQMTMSYMALLTEDYPAICCSGPKLLLQLSERQVFSTPHTNALAPLI